MKAKLMVLTLLLIFVPNPVNIFSNTADNTPLYPNSRLYPGSGLQVQTSIAVNPTNPLIMAASAITDAGYTTGAYITTNGGIDWSGTNAIKDQLNNVITTIGDPAIIIDKNGTMIITYTSLSSGNPDYKVGVSYSSNNGLYWSPTVFVPGTGKTDKVTSIADNSPLSPYYGKIYTVFSDFLYWGLYFSSSGNGGISWDTAKRISSPVIDARVGAAITLGKYGDIYVSWPFLEMNSQKSYIGFARSTDGGASWISNDTAIFVSISRLSFRIFTNGCRLNGLPTLAVDNSGGPGDGNIYITCTEKAEPGSPATDDYDILIRSSSDQGISWSNPHKVNQDNTGLLKYQCFPVLNVDNYGGVNVIYYDSRSTITNDSFEVYLARSLNGGIDFEDHLISDHKFKLKSVSPYLYGIPGYIGTYIGVASLQNKITPVWFDNYTENYQVWSANIEFGAAIKIIPEGFYNSLTNKLRSRDTIKVYLRNSDSPYHIIDSAFGILDSLTFITELIFTHAGSENYYLDIKHRNSIEVWSADPVSYSTGKHLFYDFTFSQSLTFGKNAVLKNNKWCMYGGDVNSDGAIDMDDTGLIYNDASHFTNGYHKTDVTGDGLVDLNDMNIAFNNSTNFVQAVFP